MMKERIWLQAFATLTALGFLMHGAWAEQPGLSIPATAFESGVTQTTLIELFTSEGCSSCPPADAWMSQLKNSRDLWKNIVPAVFHVDYWDRLGWPDRFAKATFTQRQRSYAASWSSGAVYTPAFVVNGKEWPGFFNHQAPPTGQAEKVGILAITLKGESEAVATFSPESSLLRPLKLEVALLGTDLQSDVKRGENNGRKLRHDFVVLHLAKQDMVKDGNHWRGAVSLSTDTQTAKPTALAAWIQSGETAPPIQATGGWLKR
jgi:hypothetical protein